MLSKERKLEIYTERLHRLSFDLAIQAAQGGKERHGIAIVAEETRMMSTRLYAMLEANEEPHRFIDDALLQLKYTAFNGWLEMLRLYGGLGPRHHDASPLAVILEEIKTVTEDIQELFGITKARPFIIQPELKHPSNITDVQIFLLQSSIGGEPFVENTAYVQEVVTYADGDKQFGIKHGCLTLRSTSIPVIDCYTRFGFDRRGTVDFAGRSCAMIINTAWEKESKKYAVLLDSLPQSFGFYSRFPEGKNVDSRSAVFSNKHVRACWDTLTEEQMIFLDWESLL